jgi:hypothetical protein
MVKGYGLDLKDLGPNIEYVSVAMNTRLNKSEDFSSNYVKYQI